MRSFTDLLDNYLDAKKALDERREGYSGYEWSYYARHEIDNYQEAADELNKAFEALTPAASQEK